jgi:hypothetical protein
MTVTTTDDLRQYLTSKNIYVTEVMSMSGGTSNYVWRIITPLGQSIIIKHAEPFRAANHTTHFPLNRMDFEAHALRTIPSIIPDDEMIQLPAFASV